MTAFIDQYSLPNIFLGYWSVINRTYKCKLRPHQGISFSNTYTKLLSPPNFVWGTYCFCSISYYYYYYSYFYSSSFFPCTMNLSTADLRNYRTEFHETWWSYRYMFLVDPKVFRFVVKGVKVIFLGVQRRWGLL